MRKGDPKRYFCTFGEKAHTSKRVSVIARDNVISKEKCATRTLEFLEPAKNPKNPSNSRRFMGVGILTPAEKNTRGPHKILCTCGAKWHQNSDFLELGAPKDTFVLLGHNC